MSEQKQSSVAVDQGPVERLDKALASLPRRQFFNDMPDKGLFAIIALSGFATIIALKQFQFNSNWVAAIAVAMMLLYGVVAYRIPEVQLRLERLGDNFYYLGFIFTLASMSSALLQLQTQRGVEIEALLGSFGIALFTTIVGVAGRVMFVQMRGEIDETEVRVRRDLLAASNDLRGQLALSLREFETFHTSMVQVAAEAVVRARKAAELQIASLESLGEDTAKGLQRTITEQNEQALKLRQSIERIAAIAEDMTKRLSATALPVEKLDQQIEYFGAGLEELIKHLQAVISQMRGRRRRFWPFGGRND